MGSNVVGILDGLGLGIREGLWEGRGVVGNLLGIEVGNVDGTALGVGDGI